MLNIMQALVGLQEPCARTLYILTTDRLGCWLASLFVCTTTRKAQKLCVKPCHAFMARIGLSKTVHKK